MAAERNPTFNLKAFNCDFTVKKFLQNSQKTKL